MPLYFQGDVCIESVADIPAPGETIAPDADGAIVLARGEVTGHRHAILGPGVVHFRDDGLASAVPPGLYLGHLRIESEHAELRHEEHDTIMLPRGCYRVRRQREFSGDNIYPRMDTAYGQHHRVED